MFCKNCGKEIADNADYCVHCGVSQSGAKTPVDDKKPVEKKKFFVCALLGFIFGLAAFFYVLDDLLYFFLFAGGDYTVFTFGGKIIFLVAGIVLSSLGIYDAKKRGGKVFGIIGLILSIIATLMQIGFFVVGLVAAVI